MGAILYYARAVDMTTQVGLSSLASEQIIATTTTTDQVSHLLDYLATYPDATVRYYASDMILNIHLDASYLSETRSRSRIARQFFLGSKPVKGKPIPLNGAILIFCGI